MADSDPHELSGIREGDVVAGKYRVERVLGTGGMGIVVSAHHLQLDEKFAIKFLRPDALSHAERFAHEARAAAKVKSEHVARVVDVGALPNGSPYMVMEYLDGGDLEAWIDKHGGVPMEQAVEFLLQACVALADVHALGIVHRDLKPANLFCVRRSDGQPSIKLLDFGISKFSNPALGKRAQAFRSTQPMGSAHPTSQMGSPSYMSPEQMHASAYVDTRTDIWSLGVILFELLTAEAPFCGNTLPEVAFAIATAPTPSVRAAGPQVPEALEAVIRKCLEKEPSDRYANVAELAIALKPFAPERAAALVERVVAIVTASSSTAIVTASSSMADSPPSPTLPWSPVTSPSSERMAITAPSVFPSSRRKTVVVGGSLAAIALAVLVGSIWPRQGDAGKERAAASGELTPASPLQAAPAPAAMPMQATVNVPAAEAPVSLGANVAPAQLETVPTNSLAPAKVPRPPAAQIPSKNPVVDVPLRRAARPLRPSGKATSQQPNCDPPYYFDDHGNRLFKKECV